MSAIDDLPAGWTSGSVLEFGELLRGVSYSKGEAKYQSAHGLVALLRANNISDELTFDDLQHVPETRVSQEQLLQAGDVVLAMSSGSKSVVGKAAQFKCPRRITFGAFCGVLRPSKGIDPAYFGYFFKSKEYRNSISEASAGTNINNLKRAYFGAIEIPLPPLAEQKRIVAKVETLLARVNAARQRLAKVPALLKRFRQSVLAAAIEDLPVVSLGAVITELKYGTATKCEAERRGIPVVRIPNIGNREVDQTDLKYADLESNEQRKLSLAPGDILVIRSNGSVSLIGKPALVSEKETGFAFAGYLMRLRLDCSRALPEYVTHVLESHSVREQIEMPARSTSGVHNINTTEVKALRIALPPLAEQHEIVRRVEALLERADCIEKRLATATRRVETLTQAILAKAFRGELVSTEAELARREGRDYEPATVLLERIRAERSPINTAPERITRERNRARQRHTKGRHR